MWVKELILDGFKSYEVRTVIRDWDPQFNCITGQNGSGKSNVMDALTFVLGLSAISEVRAQTLTDLIYKYGKTSKKKATVSITFDNSDKSMSPPEKRDQRQITVTRIVQLQRNGPNGTEKPESKFMIDGRSADREEVRRMFQSVQLNIENANFLVRQGHAMYVIEAKPRDVLQKVEEAAGTFAFREEAQESRKKLEQCERDIHHYTLQLNETIRPMMLQQRAKRDEYREAKFDFDELRIAENLLSAKSYKEAVDRVDSLEADIKECQQTVQDSQQAIREAEATIEATRTELRELRAAPVDSALEQRHTDLQQSLLTQQMQLEEANTAVQELQQREQQARSELEQCTASLASSDGSSAFLAQHAAKIENLKRVRADLDETKSLLSGLETGVSASGERETGFAAQARGVREQLSELKSQMATKTERMARLRQEVSAKDYAAAQAELKGLQTERARIEGDIQSLKKRLEDPALAQARDLPAHRSKLDALAAQERKVDQHLNELRRRDSRLEFNVPGFSRGQVRGLVGHLFSIKPQFRERATAIELCAGARLYNVVVESDEVGTRLLNSGLRRRVTLLPLNKIKARDVEPHKISAAKSAAAKEDDIDLALNVLDFDPSVREAMKYIFGSTLIANGADLAKTVAFQPRVRLRTITTQGDVYDPSGTLTGGAAAKSNGILAMFNKYNELSDEKQRIASAKSEVQAQITQCQSHKRKYDEIHAQINGKEHELRSLQRKCTEGPAARRVETYESNQKERETLEQEVEQLTTDISEHESKLVAIQRDTAEFSKDKNGKLAEIRQRVAALKEQEKALDAECKADNDKYYDMKGAHDGLEADIQRLREEIESSGPRIVSAQQQQAAVAIEVQQAEQAMQGLERELATERAALSESAELMALKEETLSACEARVSESKMQTQVQSQRLEALNTEKRTAREAANKIKAEFPEVAKNFKDLGQPGTKYDYMAETPARLAALKRYLDNRKAIRNRYEGFSAHVMEAFERGERQERSITTKVKQLENNKRKILTVVDELERKRMDEVKIAYTAISNEMGDIFGIMLKGCSCKLEPVDAEDLKQGLQIKVRIGEFWKDSVKELSGGQKSLVGLSFMFAMLKYRPAPMYLLDEVDAALDLNHTQNLGTVIKTRFKQAQFIMVSLKDNMFSSANRLFEMSQHEGRSRVRIVK